MCKIIVIKYNLYLDFSYKLVLLFKTTTQTFGVMGLFLQENDTLIRASDISANNAGKNTNTIEIQYKYKWKYKYITNTNTNENRNTIQY